MTHEELIDRDAWKAFPHSLAVKESKGKWIDYAHIRFISKILAELILKGNARIIIELPPRHGKSHLISIWLLVWFLEWFASKNIILTSYEADFASKWGRAVRNVFEESTSLETAIAVDSTARNRWNTTAGGGMNTAGMGGAITGKGADLLVIDDPIKNKKDADNARLREEQWEFFNTVLYSRLEPGGSVVLLMQRWHEDDLAGKIQSEHEDDWTVLRLPALAEEGDIMGRQPGEALCPERYTSDDLKKIKKAMGTKNFMALYQQQPLPSSGLMFQKDWIRYYRKKDLHEILGVDSSMEWSEMMRQWDFLDITCDFTFEGEAEHDFNVIQVWGTKGVDEYLLHQSRKQTGFIGQTKMIKKVAGELFPYYTRLIIEKKANGAALIETIEQDFGGIIEIKPVESKVTRAEAVTPLWESGNVYLPHPDEEPWVEEVFEKELLKFPSSKNADQVDSMSQRLRLRIDSREPDFKLI